MATPLINATAQSHLMDKVLIVWKDEYCLGLPEIDAQHASLVELINRIWKSIIDKSETPAILSIIDELEKYTIAHFSAEEDFMRATGYPDFDAHCRAHQEFIARVAQEKDRAKVSGSLSIDLTHFLRDWLLNHILVADRAYAAHTAQDHESRGSLISRFFRRFF